MTIAIYFTSFIICFIGFSIGFSYYIIKDFKKPFKDLVKSGYSDDKMIKDYIVPRLAGIFMFSAFPIFNTAIAAMIFFYAALAFFYGICYLIIKLILVIAKTIFNKTK